MPVPDGRRAVLKVSPTGLGWRTRRQHSTGGRRFTRPVLAVDQGVGALLIEAIELTPLIESFPQLPRHGDHSRPC